MAYPYIIQSHINNIISHNKTQGKHGHYSMSSQRPHASIKQLLTDENFTCDSDLIREALLASVETLLHSHETLEIKLDAVLLLVCIILKYPGSFQTSRDIYESLYENRDEIENNGISMSFSNLEFLPLKISLEFLYLTMGKDTYKSILELMPYLQDNKTNVTYMTDFLVEYLALSNPVKLPDKVAAILLQNVLQWMKLDLKIRTNSVYILMGLLRNTENQGIICNQIVKLIDSDCPHMKTRILRCIFNEKGVAEDTLKYVVSKCLCDSNFLVRKVCQEMIDAHHYSVLSE